MRIAAILITAVAFAGCKAGATMSGQTDRGGKTIKDNGQITEGDELLTDTPTAKTAKTAKTANQSPASGESPDDADAAASGTDENMQAVPPGMVAGMNLVCAFSREPAVDPSDVVYACAVADAARERVAIKGYKQRWRIVGANGTDIPSKPHALDDSADQAWDIAAADAQAGVAASLFLTDTLGVEHEIKTTCACTHTL